MKLKIVWPGKTRNRSLKELQDAYLQKINKLERCELIETKEARGLTERSEKRILAIEASGLEKHIKDDYIICLLDKGKEMNSEEFAHFLEEKGSNSTRCMTFSHELTRIVLLEQIYRSLTINHGRQYAK